MPLSEVLILLCAMAVLIGAIISLVSYEYDPVKPHISSLEVWQEVIRLSQAWKYILILFWRPALGAILILVSLWLIVRFSFKNFALGGNVNLIAAMILACILSFVSVYFFLKRKEFMNTASNAAANRRGEETQEEDKP